MGQYLNYRMGALCLLAVLLTVVAAPGRAVDANLYLAGLGLHQETGRSIYLGGIYLDREIAQPDDFTRTTGTRVMEYRVIARRTSIRSLLGGMLLQSEVATGRAPDSATADFADAILSAVSSSLYAGDSLQIESSSSGETVARLNGHELARISGSGVADYLLMGWVGESGPSTVFRNEITASYIDPELREMLETRTYSAERKAEVATWLHGSPTNGAIAAGEARSATPPQVAAAPAAPEVEQEAAATSAPAPYAQASAPAEATQPVAQAAGNDALAADRQKLTGATADSSQRDYPATAADGFTATDPESALATASPAISITTRDADPSPAQSPITVQAEPREGSDAAGQHAAAEPEQAQPPATQPHSDNVLQMASLLSPTADMLPGSALENEIAALGVQAYSQRLASFHTDLVRKVYGQIHYPKRAVRRSLEGRLELDVTLTASGDLVRVAVATTSGHQLLDEAAIAAAEEAFNAHPAQSVDPVAIAEFGSFATGELTIPIPVNFQLQ